MILVGNELVVVNAAAEAELLVDEEVLDAFVFNELLAFQKSLTLLNKLILGLSKHIVALLLLVKHNSVLGVLDETLGPCDVASVFAAGTVVWVGGLSKGTGYLLEFSLMVGDGGKRDSRDVSTAELEHELVEVLEVEFDINVGAGLVVTEHSDEALDASHE
jgi:hypothetical protein